VQHFEHEAEWMAGVVVLLLVVGVAAAFVMPYVLKEIDIDRCLDGGGGYDYAAAKCGKE
jgi:hypothetical protein